MKDSTKTGTTKLSHLFIAIVSIFGTAQISCSKLTEDVSAYSYLSIGNFSPTLQTYDTYINGVKSNSSGAVPFTGISAYTTLTAGDQKLSFTNDAGAEILLTKNIKLDESQAYSAFLIDKSDKMDVLLIKDDFTTVSTEKAFIRFINLSPDAPTLDLSLSNDVNLVSMLAYKSASEFQHIDPKTYSFTVSSNGILKASLNDQVLTAGAYYTVFSKGLLDAGDGEHAFGLQLIAVQ